MRAVPLVAAWCAALLGMTACEMINDATAPIDRDKLIEDMSEQLERGAQVRYQAEYQLAGGQKAKVGQQVSPARTSYQYPGGLLIVGETERTFCDLSVKPAKCEIRSLPEASNGSPPGYADAAKNGLVTGPVVLDLLRVASLQPDASVQPHDATIAGVQASCLEVLGLGDAIADGFITCVTADGVLARFTGLVDGITVDLALTRMTLKAPDEKDFEVPQEAEVVDLRQTPSPASIG